MSETQNKYDEFKGLVRDFFKEVAERPLTEVSLDLLVEIEEQIKGIQAGVVWDIYNVDPALAFLTKKIDVDYLGSQTTVGELVGDITIDNLLDFIESRVHDVLTIAKEEEFLDYLKRIGVKAELIKTVILRTDGEADVQTGSGEGFERPILKNNKFKLLVDVLRDNGVYGDDLLVVSGVLADSMMRDHSYICVEIPVLDKMVLVNLGYGEATFVFDKMYPRGEVFSKRKDELASNYDVKRLKFDDSNPDLWKKKMSELLFKDREEVTKEERKNVDIKKVSRDRSVEYKKFVKMDKEYFEEVDKVRYDLEMFAKKANNGKKEKFGIADLNNGKTFRDVKVVCKNGAYIMFRSYLKLCKKKLHLKSNKEALDTLKKMLGYAVPETRIYSKMDREYFENGAYVKHDLEAFARAKGSNFGVLDLTAGPKFTTVEAKCSNGEKISLNAYLCRFGGLIGLSKKEALYKLFELAGYVVMDKSYFLNKEYVKHDLNAFVDAKTGCLAVVELSTTDVSIEAKCSNGEKISFNAYLRRCKDRLNLSTFREALDELLKLLGYEAKMNEKYFRNVKNVRYDLKAFAREASKGKEETYGIADLNNGNKFVGVEAKCSNGKRYKFNSYLGRCKSQLRLKSNKEALDTLKRLLGYAVPETRVYPKMDKEYFENVENVRHDLEAFAKKASHVKKEKVGIADLNNGRKFVGFEAKCSNGEDVIFNTYLFRVKRVFKLSGQREALDKLLTMLGYECVKYPDMDREYFENVENVRYDLEVFARAKDEGLKVTDLYTSPKFLNLKAVCSNGEDVRFGTYLRRVKRVFKLSGQREALDKLLKMLGYKK